MSNIKYATSIRLKNNKSNLILEKIHVKYSQNIQAKKKMSE
jgi:hypothetical protein